MARVRNPKPRPRPIYPTSGNIHIFEGCAMRLACLEGESLSWSFKRGKRRGVVLEVGSVF
jgi:hypothetical protein